MITNISEIRDALRILDILLDTIMKVFKEQNLQ